MNKKLLEEAKERSKRILVAENGNIKAPIFLSDLEILLQVLEQYEKQIDYVDKNYISKEAIKIKNKELYKEYKQALLTNSTKAFILKCKIESIDELLEEKKMEILSAKFIKIPKIEDMTKKEVENVLNIVN